MSNHTTVANGESEAAYLPCFCSPTQEQNFAQWGPANWSIRQEMVGLSQEMQSTENSEHLFKDHRIGVELARRFNLGPPPSFQICGRQVNTR